MDRGVVQGLFGLANPQKTSGLLIGLLTEAGNFEQLLALGKGPLAVAMANDGLGQRLADTRNEAEQGPAGGVEIDADVVDAGFYHLFEGFFQGRLADVVLILADADTLGIDLDQFGQRVLQAAGDGDGAAHGQVEIGELLPSDVRRRVDAGSGLVDHDDLQF